MKSFSALVFASIIISVYGSAQVDEILSRRKGEVTAVEVEPGQAVRAYSASWYPDDHPRAISLKGVEIKVVDEDTATISAVEFDISTIDQTAMAFAYFTAVAEAAGNLTNGNLTTVKAAFFAFILRFYAPFEYVDVNGIPGYQNGSGDQLTGLYDLSSPALPWKDFVIEENDITGTDGNTYKLFYITAETLDEVFLMRYTICGTNVAVPGAVVTSQSTKMDIGIRWFTSEHVAAVWTTGPSNPIAFPNAHVGLVLAMGAFAETASAGQGQGSATPSLNFTGEGFVAFFTWQDTVDVTDKTGASFTGDVYVEVIELTESVSGSNMDGEFVAGWVIEGIFFSFEGNRPSLVFWDPSVGAQQPYDSSSSDSVLIAPTAFFIMLIISLIF